MPEGFINILTYPDWRKSRWCGRGTQSILTISTFTQVGSTNNWFRYQRIWKWTFLKHNTEQVGMAIVLLCWEALLIVGTVERDTLALPLWIGFGFLNEFTAGEVWETDPVTWIFGVVRMPATTGREPFSWETDWTGRARNGFGTGQI